MEFSEPWSRVQKIANISKYTELAEILGITQQSVSKAAGKEFPVKWAFTIAQKYEISTDWIMTGKMPSKNLPVESKGMEESEEPIMKEISEWLDEKIQREPKRREWFEMSFCDNYPDFAQWREQKKEEWCLSNAS